MAKTSSFQGPLSQHSVGKIIKKARPSESSDQELSNGILGS
jgi:hypothetical protein